MTSLSGKKILFGITGGIAAYKAADWVSSLRKEGADVTVIMTEAATRFVSPVTFAALSGNRVHTTLFEEHQSETIPHITLAKETDLLVIAPATANTIAKLSQGLADDLLTTVALAVTSPVIIFPAMNSNMFLHPATKANLRQLKKYNYIVVNPDSGNMACGDSGPGRLPEYSTAKAAILSALTVKDLSGHTIVITAGPTQEPLDPVRFLSNRSSGKMGYALAGAAAMRGADVTLISGPTNLTSPPGVNCIQVRTADEMHKAVSKKSALATLIIKSAAVSDYRPQTISKNKIKKGAKSINLPLVANKDILKELGTSTKRNLSCLLVGFAAESKNHLAEGKRKLQEKKLDMIVINDILSPHTGFESETNQVVILDKSGSSEKLPLLTKDETAHRILDKIVSYKSSQ